MKKVTVQLEMELLCTFVDIEADTEKEAFRIAMDRVRCSMARISNEYSGSYDATLKKVLKP